MKNILLIFTFMFGVQMYGQDGDFWKKTRMSQKQRFKDAESLLKKSEEIQAIFKYHYVYGSNLDTEYEKIAKKRLDSLLPIVQRKHLQKIKGKWKLKFLTNEFLSYKPVYEYIEIKDDKIIFFEQNSDIPSRVENIVLTPYDNSLYNRASRDVSSISLIFENNEIWEFSGEEKNKEKRIYPRIKWLSNGPNEEWIDEISIIIDRKELKKVLAEERRTYYVLVKE